MAGMDKYLRCVKFFKEKEKPLDEIRNHLQRFLGGSVSLTRRDDGLAFITLNHSPKKNSISGKMMVDLFDIVEELEKWKDGKGVILNGEGENFCSGGDLNFARQTGTPEEGFWMSTFMNNILYKFERLPLISVALIDGIGALGGGAELSLACDYRLITDNCQGIGFVHAKMGIIPAWGGITRLVEKIGCKEALNLLCTAKILNPSECLRLSLVDEIIPQTHDGSSYATSWLKERTNFNTEVIRAIKVATCISHDNGESLKIESRIFSPFWGSPGNKEALSKNIKHKVENNEDLPSQNNDLQLEK